MCFLTFSTTFVNLILRTDNFQLRRIYVNKNRSCKYKRIAINIYKINKLKAKFFFNSTDELGREQVKHRTNCNSFCHIHSFKNIQTSARLFLQRNLYAIVSHGARNTAPSSTVPCVRVHIALHIDFMFIKTAEQSISILYICFVKTSTLYFTLSTKVSQSDNKVFKTQLQYTFMTVLVLDAR